MTSRLTRRHKDILSFLAQKPLAGNEAIAARFSISKHTVRQHMKDIYRILEIDGNQYERRLTIVMKATDMYIKGELTE